VRCFLTGVGGSNNGLGGGSAGFEIGTKQWQFWASGGGQRTGDYQTRLRTVANSQTRLGQTNAGLGRYGEKGFFSLNYSFTTRGMAFRSTRKRRSPKWPIFSCGGILTE
jgi:hypothetical protein